MNEAGLIVELMWLSVGQYPAPDARPALGCLEWIQYQLDHYSTVDEVVAAQSEVRIGSEIPLHYLVCDRNGQCATIEFLGGKFVPHTGKDLPQLALTNDSYDTSLKHLSQFKGFGGDKPLPKDDGSLSRFVIASAGVQGFESAHPKSAVDYAFDVLHQAAQGSVTKWSIVYEPRALQVHFRTLGNPKVRSLDLKAFDLSCQTPVRMLDMAESLDGPVTARFVDYSLDKNRALIDSVFSKVDF
jgi:choloylglycine hydrolase